MASGNKFQIYVQNVANGVHNFNTDVFKVCLTDVAPVATNTVFANITEIAAVNGYAAGGATVTLTSSSETAGTYKYIATCANPTWTASGGAIAQFRYFVLYDTTPTVPLKPLVAWWDYGSEVNLANTQTFYVSFDVVNGILQLS